MSWPFARYAVTGTSMYPALQEGEHVLVCRWGKVRPGDIAVFFKNGANMIKRAVKKENKTWIMRGDNFAASTDSLDFGHVHESQIIGKVIAMYH